MHSLCTHYALTMHPLCTHYALTMHPLGTHFALTMHSLCIVLGTHYALTMHSLCIVLCTHYALTLGADWYQATLGHTPGEDFISNAADWPSVDWSHHQQLAGGNSQSVSAVVAAMIWNPAWDTGVALISPGATSSCTAGQVDSATQRRFCRTIRTETSGEW
jgi:hypothetical protein